MIPATIKGKKARLTIHTSEDDWESYQQIKWALDKKPKTLHLEIIGFNRIHPTPMLSIYDLLRQRNPSVTLEVAVKTNLMDGCLLFLIPADKIKIRQHAWLQVSTIKQLADEQSEEGESWDASSKANMVYESPSLTDYRTILKILGEYFPLHEFSNKRIPLEQTLRDFGMMKDQEEEEALLQMFQAAA